MRKGEGQVNWPRGVRVIEGAVKDCDKIIKFAEDQGFTRSAIGANPVPSQTRTSSTCFLPIHSFENPDYIYNMHKVIYVQVGKYAKEFGVDLTLMEDASVQKYEPGQLYKSHIDAGPGQPRVISALVYLNDTDGGDTYFNEFDWGVTPKEGTLVIFPSNYIYRHEAKPPNSGLKYAVAYWIQG
jgi:hypothetical protein